MEGDYMTEPMFGKPERLYADARKTEAQGDAKPAAPKPVRVELETKPQVEAVRREWRGGISTVLELAGITSVSVGGFLVSPWLGCMMLGLLLIVLGVATGYGA